MVLNIEIDEELMNGEGELYKLRSVYEKNNLVHVKFETKFGMHRGTYKKRLLYINPETGREYLYGEIDKCVKVLFDTNTNKKYSSTFSKNINKIIEVKEKEVVMSNEEE